MSQMDPDDDADRLAMIPMPRVREMVAAEREACARHLEASAERWSDKPHVQAVLRGEAQDIRARGGPTREPRN